MSKVTTGLREISVTFEDGRVETNLFGHRSTNKAVGYFVAAVVGLLASLFILAFAVLVTVAFYVAVFVIPLIGFLLPVLWVLIQVVIVLSIVTVVLSIPLNFLLKKLGREGFLVVTPNSFRYVVSIKGFRKRSC